MDYEHQLQQFLYTVLLKDIIPDPETRKLYVTNEAMTTWYQAFTDTSASLSSSYELLEKIGDAVLKDQFVKYLIHRFPNLTEQGVNAFQDRYMSKDPQRNYTIMLGLYKYMIYEDEMDLVRGKLEDLMEATCGALAVVSDKISEGLGSVNVYNFLEFLFRHITIDPDLVYGRSKSQLKEIVEMLSWFDPKDSHKGVNGYLRTESISRITDPSGARTRTRVVLTKRAEQYLKSLGEDPANYSREQYMGPSGLEYVLGLGDAPSKKQSEEIAFDEAFNMLRSKGITKQTVRERQIVSDFQAVEMENFIAPMMSKVKSLGYLRPIFNLPEGRITRHGRLVQLAGQKDNGNMDILIYTVSTEKSLATIKLKLVEALVQTPIEELPIKIKIEPL